MHKTWIRAAYIEEHHPDCEREGKPVMNDWRWYMDGELSNVSMERGLFEKLKPLRKLMTAPSPCSTRWCTASW